MIEFAKADIGPAEEQAVLEVLRSGWMTSGAKMREFEQLVSSYLNGPMCLAVNSATSGLHLALEACGVGSGDEVILPTLTFTATAEVVRYLGATPVFADVDPHTLCLSPIQVAEKLTSRTKAVIPVHFGGYGADMPALSRMRAGFGFRVIEDAAHALGSVTWGDRVGDCHWSDATVFSFYATKCITTGEGGMVTTKDLDLARRMSTMRLHGISRDAFDRYKQENGWEYDVVAPGFKYNLPDVLAAIGVEQFKRMFAMRAKRREIARAYDLTFKDLPVILPLHEDLACTSACHLYVLRLKYHDRNEFVRSMAEKGVRCSVHFKPLHQMTVWKPYAEGQSFPVADAAYQSCVSLPIYSSMTYAEIDQVVEAVKACLK